MKKIVTTVTRVCLCAWLLTALLLATATMHAATPESVQVRAMIDKGIAYLSRGGRPQGENGEMALVGLAMIKTEHEKDHPAVKAAVAACQAEAALVERSGIGTHTYSSCICAIFLCELDPHQYRAEIEVLLRGISERQRPNGCWSYKAYNYDDTTQSQFGMLALWAAHEKQFQVSAEQVERALNWFLRVQDVQGGWSYDPTDPQRSERARQGQTTPGMTAAGLGSVFVGNHLLGITAVSEKEKDDRVIVPPALISVEDKNAKAKPKSLKPTRTNAAAVKASQALGEAWFAKEGWRFKDERWQYYYVYALERCMSFRERVTGKLELEPDWYNAGVAFLQETQEESGAWSSATGPTVGTAFAILFLTRSTRTSLRTVEYGSVQGSGKSSLPDDLTDIWVDANGTVTGITEIQSIAFLLDRLENADFDAFDFPVPEQLNLSANPAKRADELVRLRRMVMSGSYLSRLTAVKTISRDRNLDNISVLIYALSDPDFRVAGAAQNGLRYISRRVEGFGPNVGDRRPTRQQFVAAQNKWKDWYRSIRPDGALID